MALLVDYGYMKAIDFGLLSPTGSTLAQVYHRVGQSGLRVAQSVITKKCAYYLRYGKPARRARMLDDSDYTIVSQFQSAYRGLVHYYLLAQDVFRFQKLRWVMETSMLKTLAGKHHSTVQKMVRKYKATTDTTLGP